MSDHRPARDPFVFLAQPGYGDLAAGAARGLWRATRLADDRVWRQHQQGSLLAANFNGLWVTALNLAREGRVDYFAMIHADVEPEDWWLDTLIAEMDAHDLDVLGCAVPIKDHYGVTSLALARDDGDPWRPHCRLTLADVHRLPPTFTSADVGRPLLLNTGLWACRFDPTWARLVHFEVNDRIYFDTGAGRYRAQCEPEDWFFSRQLHEIGAAGSPSEGLRPLRVGATRKVRLLHRGPAEFTNAHAWGDPVDRAYLEASPIPESADPFVLPDIEGWLAYEEGAALAELARGRRVLEVGSYCGLSTVCMARTATEVAAVDTWDGRATPRPRETIDDFRDNLARHGVADKVQVLWGSLADRLLLPGDRFDLVFIDGAHDRRSVDEDIAHALELLAPDGLIAFHDYGSPIHPAVAAAVDALVGRGAQVVNVVGSLAVVTPPAAVPSLQLQEA